jgi:periplasmic protein TonB
MPSTPDIALNRPAPDWGAASELSPAQRWVLGGLAVAAHVAAGVHLLQWRDEPLPPEIESAPLMVSMIAPAIKPPQPALSAPPAPPVAPVRPVVPAPTVLSSKAPSSNPLVAPPEVPKPTVKPEVTPLAPAPAAPAPTPSTATAPEAPPAPAAPLPPKQITASAVRYLVPPQQVYPETSRRLGESGKVGLRVLVDEHGKAVDVQVTQSSGFSRLDQSAVSAMKAARFQPYLENGVARSVWAPATITYDLQD